MPIYKTIFTTGHDTSYQKQVIAAAPPELAIKLLCNPDSATLRHHLEDAVFWISGCAETIDITLLDNAPKLRLIQRLGRLTHDINVQAAQQRNIQVTYMPDPDVIRMAEHCIMQMLMLAKRAKQVEQIVIEASDTWGERKRTDENTFALNWGQQNNIGTLFEKTVGIIGFGEVGAEITTRLQGWDVNLFYNSSQQLPERIENELGLMYVPAKTLFKHSDYVVNLMNYLPEKHLSINTEWFSIMKNGAYFVSVGSGGIVDETAIAEALKLGKLGGAALDTFELEPIKNDNPLISLVEANYNMLLTPHTAAVGEQTGCERNYQNVLRYLRNELLLYQVV